MIVKVSWGLQIKLNMFVKNRTVACELPAVACELNSEIMKILERGRKYYVSKWKVSMK